MPVSTSSINLSAATSSSISMGSESDQQYRTALSRSVSNASSLHSRCPTISRSDQMSSATGSGKKGGECPESDQEPGVSKKVYVSKKIVQKAFTVLNEFRTQNILSDVTIRVDTRDFSAHRVILAATSPYFQAMFTSKYKSVICITTPVSAAENDYSRTQAITNTIGTVMANLVPAKIGPRTKFGKQKLVLGPNLASKNWS